MRDHSLCCDTCHSGKLEDKTNVLNNYTKNLSHFEHSFTILYTPLFLNKCNCKEIMRNCIAVHPGADDFYDERDF